MLVFSLACMSDRCQVSALPSLHVSLSLTHGEGVSSRNMLHEPRPQTTNSALLTIPRTAATIAMGVEDLYQPLIPKADWVSKIISFQADIIYNCIMTLLSPFISLFSIASQSYRQAEEATATVESVIVNFPYKLTHGTSVLLRRIGLGIVGALHVCMVLITVMVLAIFLGVGLVQMWAEEPVFLRERLFFDYTDVNPKAVFGFDGFDGWTIKRSTRGIPIGHTFDVSLVLLLPESDHNRQIGVFQLTAELLSANGNAMAKSSQPCMLRFRSFPIRLMRTFLMGLPLALGISEETQKLSVELMLEHEESYPRTKAIRVTLIPRAGTSSLPQLYEAEIIMNSELPWTRQVVRNWKWTFCVWASLYIYILLVIFLVSCCRPLLFPVTTAANLGYVDHLYGENDVSTQEAKEPGKSEVSHERMIADVRGKWEQRRKKRKAMFSHGGHVAETLGSSSASSMSVSRGDTSVVLEEDTGDSESVCFGGC